MSKTLGRFIPVMPDIHIWMGTASGRVWVAIRLGGRKRNDGSNPEVQSVTATGTDPLRRGGGDLASPFLLYSTGVLLGSNRNMIAVVGNVSL